MKKEEFKEAYWAQDYATQELVKKIYALLEALGDSGIEFSASSPAYGFIKSVEEVEILAIRQSEDSGIEGLLKNGEWECFHLSQSYENNISLKELSEAILKSDIFKS